MVYSGIGQTRHSNIAGSSAGDCDDKCTQRISIGSLAFPAVSCIVWTPADLPLGKIGDWEEAERLLIQTTHPWGGAHNT